MTATDLNMEKESRSMKIAIPSTDDRGFDSQVEQHFGRARYYTIVNTEDMSAKSVPVPFENHGPGDIPNFLKEHGANVIIAYGMGGKAVQFFDDMGIEVITGAMGRVGDVVDAYMKAKLAVDSNWKDDPGFGEHKH